MKKSLKIFLIGWLAAGLMACGDDDDDAETIECGEGTVVDEDSGECVDERPDECPEGEVKDAVLGECVDDGTGYCGEGAELNLEVGQCQADPVNFCGDGTTEEDDGVCVEEEPIECGENTVVASDECVPAEDVCADLLEQNEDYICGASPDMCGSGTVFDVDEQKCVQEFTLECGAGTSAIDGVCLPTRVFYEDLADEADYDLDDEGGSLTLPLGDAGEDYVLVGTIDESEDGEQTVHEVQMQGESGQWMRISLYSLGLPEPGFINNGPFGYYRVSQKGGGIELVRDHYLPHTGNYNLSISNMPQLKELLPPGGGDDWKYVAYIEMLDAPEAQEVDLDGGEMSGDIRHLRDNYFMASGTDDIDAVALFFDDNAPDAEGRLQIWDDEGELDREFSIEDASVEPIEPPSDEFYILYDYRRARGTSFGYEVSSEVGELLDNGQSLTIDHSLEAGDYVGINQFNLDEVHLNASIRDSGGTVLTEETVGVSTSDEPPRSVYWYASEAMDVELRLQNTSGDDIEYLTYEILEGSAEAVSGIDGDLVEVDYDGTLEAGTRHYYELEVEFDDLLGINVSDTLGEAHLTLYDDAGNEVSSGTNALVTEVDEGDYVLSVKAVSDMSNFTINLEESQIFEVEETSAPGESIPGGGTMSDSMTIDNCPNINEIEITLDITHNWIGDLEIDITNPSGDTVRIHDGTGGATDDIQATYPFPGDSNLSDAEDLLDWVDTNGAGEWVIDIEDTWLVGSNTGALESWTINLTCEG